MPRLALAPTAAYQRRDRSLRLRNRLIDRLRALHHAALVGFLRGRVGNAADADDLAQEAYLRLCRQPDLDKIEGRERAYLFRTAGNLLRDRHRRAVTRATVPADDLDWVAGADAVAPTTPDDDLAYRETLTAVRGAILTMRPEVRRVFLIRRFGGATNREIARRLGVSERTVERRMHAALAALKRAVLPVAEVD